MSTMMPLNVPDACESKVINAKDLATLSGYGWRPIAMYEEEAVERGTTRWNGSTHVTTEPTVYKVMSFVVIRSEGSAIEAANKLREDAEGRALLATSAKIDLEKRNSAHVEKALHLGKEIETLTNERGTLRAQVRAAEDRAQKMERDLAKIRQDIGESRMKEILLAEKAKP
jgi:hypothetical protein